VLAGQAAGQRDEHLRDDRGEPDDADRRGQDRERRRRGGDRQARGRDQEHPRDHPSAVQQVAQRDEQHEARGVPDLGGGDQQARGAGADAEVAGDHVQQRLGVVEVGDRGAAGDGQQHHQPAVHGCGGGSGGGDPPSL
jgi:hypothetical protein